MKRLSRNEFAKQIDCHVGKTQYFTTIELKKVDKDCIDLLSEIELNKFNPTYKTRQIDSIKHRSKDIIINNSHLYIETGQQYYLLSNGILATYCKHFMILYKI